MTIERDALAAVRRVDREERLAQRGPSAVLLVITPVALLVVVAAFLVPTGDDASGEMAGSASGYASPRAASVETYSAVLEKCYDSESWRPAQRWQGTGGLWETFVGLHAARAEVRYCEQWLGGQLLLELLGIGPSSRVGR